MKNKIIFLISIFTIVSCAFAPLTVPVPPTELTATSTLGTICYSMVQKKAPANFRSVKYFADALYSSGQSIGNNQGLNIIVYARASDPLPGASISIKCITAAGAADKLISQNIYLKSGQKKRIEVGGSSLAGIVTHDKYWIGVSTTDSAFISFPGTIKLTNGVIQVFF